VLVERQPTVPHADIIPSPSVTSEYAHLVDCSNDNPLVPILVTEDGVQGLPRCARHGCDRNTVGFRENTGAPDRFGSRFCRDNCLDGCLDLGGVSFGLDYPVLVAACDFDVLAVPSTFPRHL
jgi:hypothetical protein